MRTYNSNPYGCREVDVLPVVSASNAAAGEVRIAVVCAHHVAPCTVFGAPHVEAETPITVEPRAQLLVTLRAESESVCLHTFLHPVQIARPVTVVEGGVTAVAGRVDGESGHVGGVTPQLRGIVIAVFSFSSGCILGTGRCGKQQQSECQICHYRLLSTHHIRVFLWLLILGSRCCCCWYQARYGGRPCPFERRSCDRPPLPCSRLPTGW